MIPAEASYDASWLQAFVHQMLLSMGLGWEEMFIPGNVYLPGAIAVVEAADQARDQTPAGRLLAGQLALRAALSSTGQSGQITDAQVQAGAAAVLKADTAWQASQAKA